MFSFTMNFIQKVLGDRFEEWKSSRGMLYGRAKNAPFEELYVTRKPIGFFEYKYIFTALSTIVPSHLMNEKYAVAYRRLKGMECDLKMKGIFKKKAFFILRKDLAELARIVEGLALDETLARALTEDVELIEKVQKLGAVELSVRLKSVSELYAPFVSSREAMLQAEKAFYENPEDLTWIVSLSMILTQGPKLKRNILLIYDVLYDVSEKIRNISQDVVKTV